VIRGGRAPVVLAAGALVLGIALEAFEVRASTATDTLVYGGVARFLRRVTDFDGDGSSSFFGGRDCRAFDDRFAPGKRDTPGNGLDEDCSGSDSRPPSPVTRPDYRVIDARGFNVVWLSIDALRADHVGSYGYGRKTTPNVDAIARDAIRFERAYAQSTGTWDSVPSMLSGRYPHALSRDYAHPRAKLGRRWYSYHLGPGMPLVSDVLARSGYATAGFASFRLFHWLGFDQRFNVYERTPDHRRSGLAFITTAKEPFFLWQHLPHPHEPYVPHAGFDFGPTSMDRYDGEIAYSDSIIGALVDGLKKRGVFERTLLVITADHGEALGERGAKYHARSCYEEQVRVPLIVRVPGMKPAVVKAPVELVGVVPTLLELLQLPVGSLRLDGQSLLGAMATPDSRGTQGAYCEYVAQAGVTLQSLIERDWKVISDLERDRIELYHLESDPFELRNLTREQPAMVERLVSELGHRYARP
jgi:arylsulfatase A-like enzyme